MRTWTAHATTDARPEDILAALTDPERCRDWAPVPFEVDDDRRLRTGTRTRVNGRLAGMRVGFDVEIHHADDRRLHLSARGVGGMYMDVDYDVAPTAGGTEVRASVSVLPGRGLLSTVAAEATAGLLRAGALSAAVDRLTRVAVAA